MTSIVICSGPACQTAAGCVCRTAAPFGDSVYGRVRRDVDPAISAMGLRRMTREERVEALTRWFTTFPRPSVADTAQALRWLQEADDGRR